MPPFYSLEKGGHLENMILCNERLDVIHVFHLSGTPYINVSKGVDILNVMILHPMILFVSSILKFLAHPT
jgi:hypothetical protein